MIKVNLPQFFALLYADVFEYPLTKQELAKFEIRNSKFEINPKSKIQNYIKEESKYYSLKGRENLVSIRKQREKFSQEKLDIARRVGKWLKIIPAVKMLAVSGAVAVGNADKDDDIDFLIITKPGTIWTTRFFSIILLEFLGKRRRPNDKNFKNKICLNMFVDENHLQVPKNEQDLFSAHEAAQIKILWSRGDTEEKWWKNNKWINKFLPKFKDSKTQRYKGNSKIKVQNNFFKLWILKLICHLSFVICHFWERVCKNIQLWYMHSKRTKEVVKAGYLRFHPHDARGWVMKEYMRRLRKYGLG